MATAVGIAFQELRQRLEISGLQESTVSTRHNNVREALKGALPITESFLTGSYSRNTLIAPLKQADIDIFAILEPTYFHHYNGKNGGPASLLDLVKRALRKTYSQTPDISRNGQAVTIRFTDFTVDVIPAFHRQGGGYLIPNSATQTWISTDPRRHVTQVSAANKRQEGLLVPTIKMVKGWNREHGQFFHSFHLEVLALEAFSAVSISDFPSGVRFFFDKAKNLVTQQNLDPAGYGGDVGEYITTQSQLSEAVSKLTKAYERSVLAEDYARRGTIQLAIQTWQQVFKGYFPAYG